MLGLQYKNEQAAPTHRFILTLGVELLIAGKADICLPNSGARMLHINHCSLIIRWAIQHLEFQTP